MRGVSITVGLIVLFLFAPNAARAQAPAAPAPRKLEFEVASVKPVDPGVTCCYPPQIDPGRFVDKDALNNLIGEAYRAIVNCPSKMASGDCAFPGAPAWIYKDRFAIEAKLPPGSPSYSRSQFMGGRAPELSLMLQALLEDRFRLKVHWETRTVPIYALTVGKSGPKLKPSAGPLEFRPDARTNNVTIVTSRTGSTLILMDSSMQDFASSFERFMDRPVLDRTGLKGNFDFKVTWKSDPDVPSNSGPGYVGSLVQAGPAMFTAIEELGLKLEPTKGPVEVLVIDHVEQPSAN